MREKNTTSRRDANGLALDLVRAGWVRIRTDVRPVVSFTLSQPGRGRAVVVAQDGDGARCRWWWGGQAQRLTGAQEHRLRDLAASGPLWACDGDGELIWRGLVQVWDLTDSGRQSVDLTDRARARLFTPRGGIDPRHFQRIG